jgi:hypothetical protein
VEAVATAAGERRRTRRALLLLIMVMVVGGALRIWYLPAAEQLDSEGVGIENIESLLAGGEMRRYGSPALSWYPQRLALGLADWLHDVAGTKALHVLTAKDRVTRRGLGVARYLSLLYGVASIALLYWIARRLHSTAVALLAALVLCFSPWHIQGSVNFAPGILVLLLSLLALGLGLRALDRPSPARLAQVGVALGIAAAADVSGGLIALPVLVGLVAGGRRELRRMLLPVAITVPVAVLIWWALNPPLGLFAETLDLEQASQTRRAAREMSSRFTVAVFGFLHPLRHSVHGRLLGALALLGAAGQAFRYLFLIDPGSQRAPRLMVLATAPVFILGYAWATPLYRESGFVPLLAFSSLYAAVMLEVLWDGMVALAPRLAAPRAAAVAAALVVVLVAPAGWRFVHSKAVASTLNGAVDWLRREFSPAGGPRLALVEQAAAAASTASLMDLAQGIGLRVVPRLAAVAEERLAGADAEIFLQSELEGADGAFYRARGQSPARRKLITGNLLWQRGPDLVVVFHPFGNSPGERVVLPIEQRDRSRVANVPEAAEGVAALSLVLQLPPTVEAAPVAPRVRLGEVEIALAPAGRIDGKPFFVSERLPARPAAQLLEVQPLPWMSTRLEQLTASMFLWR